MTLTRECKLRFRLMLTALAVSCFSLHAQPTKDVNGWGKLKWGMTVEQATAEYSGSFKVLPNKENTRPEITIKDVEVGRLLLDVSVVAVFGPTIDNITLEPQPHKDWEYTRQQNFDLLKVLLVEKYGAPTNEDRTNNFDYANKPDGTRTVVIWALPSTTIKLLWSEQSKSGSLFVEYTPPNRKFLSRM